MSHLAVVHALEWAAFGIALALAATTAGLWHHTRRGRARRSYERAHR